MDTVLWQFHDSVLVPPESMEKQLDLPSQESRFRFGGAEIACPQRVAQLLFPDDTLEVPEDIHTKAVGMTIANEVGW